MDERRKRLIIAHALYVAAKHLAELPPEDQPASNIADMRELLATEFKAEASLVVPDKGPSLIE